jgi:predicted nuclease of restriction endonuclease-like (RecB) superfamily
VDTLERARKFYLVYPIDDKKSATPLRISENSNEASFLISTSPTFSPNLSWGHYLLLIRIKRDDARKFYEIEAIKNHWTTRELKRQTSSLLYERLSKSKNKEELTKLAYQGQEVNIPSDAIKDPFVLEFLGLPESHQLIESKLENALIQNMQKFLLELGRGFAFVARQKRLTLEGDHFYTDLVMYNIPLKSYVVLDIKTRALTHADLGQMQLYVNYFDQEIKLESDNPTIGLVLCTGKNDSMVKYLLGENAKKIFASTYQFHLPSEQELETELKRELKQIEQKKLIDLLKKPD